VDVRDLGSHALAEFDGVRKTTVSLSERFVLSSLPNGRKREPGEFDEEIPQLLKHVLDHFRRDFGYSENDLEKLLLVTPERLMTQCYEQVARPRLVPTGRQLRSISEHDTM
jgi:hypothetical protein